MASLSGDPENCPSTSEFTAEKTTPAALGIVDCTRVNDPEPEPKKATTVTLRSASWRR